MNKHLDPQRRRYETLQSAAERLAVDTRTLRRWIAAGRLNAYRTGPRVIRVNVQEVDALLTPVAGVTDQSVASEAVASWRFPA